MQQINRDYWNDRSVFVTGHMGFKGAWLVRLLSTIGALSWGYGRDERRPLLYPELMLERHTHRHGELADLAALTAALEESGAEVLIHLAAQPIVLTSYEDPLGTFQDNIIGTANVLQAARSAPSLKAIVVVTSDKVYRNNEWAWGYRESDHLGGADPYSASKAAAEIVTAAMVSSYFGKEGAPRVVTARAGNVIGGGDWADYRLLPDAARALGKREPLVVRNPASTRPWQHVLDPLHGYLLLAERLAQAAAPTSNAWNFGPATEDVLAVGAVADLFVETWGEGATWKRLETGGDAPKETRLLQVDSALARDKLGWAPKWRVREAIQRTASWYRDYFAAEDPTTLVDRDIDDFLHSVST
jgi:CDP-glucose 4,6-dehydratase